MSRQQTVLDTFHILDDHCDSNFMGVDVNGRTSEFVDASYRHQIKAGSAEVKQLLIIWTFKCLLII